MEKKSEEGRLMTIDHLQEDKSFSFKIVMDLQCGSEETDV
jgi:hypothetical protein